MTSTPDPGAPEPELSEHGECTEESWLSSRRVAGLWPVREARLPDAARRAGVRYNASSGRSTGTWGSGPTTYFFHPGDVERAARAFAEGRVDVPSGWRTDTAVGRCREFCFKTLVYGAAALTVAALVAAVLGLPALVVFALTVE
jgi:hypothetical protein